MSDLLSLLSLGSAGIAAQNTGVSVATNNVANANTAGYSRQRVDLEALPGSPLIGGVRSGSPDRLQDHLLAGRIRTAHGSLEMARAFANALSDVEARLAGSGPTLDEQLGTLFSRINQVAAAPTDSLSRDAVIAATQALVDGIDRRAAEIASARNEADARIEDNSVTATALAKQLAETNTQIARTNDPAMRDQRDQLATRLAELVGGAARIDGDGQMRFVLDGGAVLVDGGRAATLAATPDPSTGLASLAVVDGANRRDVTQTIGGGRIGADLSVRDKTLAQTAAQLDQFAFDLATTMNAQHTANAGLDGVSGRPMFAPLAQVAGAAAALAIDPALEADSSLLATAAPGTGPGNNAGALALFGLASQPVATGGVTLGEAALGVISSVAVEAAGANQDVARDELVTEHLAGLRDSLAGVDIQEELTNLARFEHASSAMVKFVSTIDDLLGSLIDRL